MNPELSPKQGDEISLEQFEREQKAANLIDSYNLLVYRIGLAGSQEEKEKLDIEAGELMDEIQKLNPKFKLPIDKKTPDDMLDLKKEAKDLNRKKFAN